MRSGERYERAQRLKVMDRAKTHLGGLPRRVERGKLKAADKGLL